MVQVKVDNHIVSVKESPITAIFHQLNSKVEFMDCLEIDHVMSLQHYNKLAEIEPIVAKLWKVVFHDFEKEITKRSISLCPEGHQALAGRIDLTLRCMIDKKKFMWKLPETMIHPHHQVNLGDLIIIMSKPELLKKYYQESCE